MLRVTQKLDVIDENPENQQKGVFFSRVEDVGENSVFITPPFRKGVYLPAQIGRIIVARVVVDKLPYLFEAKLLQYLSDQIPMWEVSKPSTYNKIQLRADVRLEIGVKVNLLVTTPRDGLKIYKTLTRDLSAGGMQVVLPHTVPVGSIVNINFTIESEFHFEAQGTIVRLVPPLQPQDKLFAGIKFMEVDELTKKKILRFIFSRQAAIRMKEKGWLT